MPVIPANPKKARNSLKDFGTDHSATALIFSGLVLIPPSDTTCPRKETDFWNNTHFSGFNFSPAERNRFSITFQMLMSCLKKTVVSSKYTRRTWKCNPDITMSIRRWNVAWALQSRKSEWHRPKLVHTARTDKHRFITILWINQDLMIRWTQIKHGEPLRWCHGVQTRIDMRCLYGLPSSTDDSWRNSGMMIWSIFFTHQDGFDAYGLEAVSMTLCSKTVYLSLNHFHIRRRITS